MIVGARGAQAQASLGDGQHRVGRQHVDMIALQTVAVAGLAHRHRGAPPDDLAQHADPTGRQMGNHDECHARRGRHRLEKPLQRLDAAGRGTDSHSAEVAAIGAV